MKARYANLWYEYSYYAYASMMERYNWLVVQYNALVDENRRLSDEIRRLQGLDRSPDRPLSASVHHHQIEVIRELQETLPHNQPFQMSFDE